MELEELRIAWRQLNEQMTANRADFSALRTELKLEHARGRLRRFKGLPSMDIAVGLLAALMLGSLLGNGHHVWYVVASAVVLDLVAIASIIVGAWQLAMVTDIDYSEPVFAVQRKLQAVRMLRIRNTQWLLLASPLLWTLLAIVVFQGLLGVNVVRVFGPTYVEANLAFGIVAIPVLYEIARRVGDRWSGSPVLVGLLDDLGGRSLGAALKDLEELASFEQA